MDTLDAVLLSDLHLGSGVCQTHLLHDFLEKINKGKISTHQLILNGDVFNSMDLRRLRKDHWRILSDIRSISDHVHVVWIGGNHDGPVEQVSNLLGVDVAEEYEFTSGGKRMLAFHGDRYDKFITKHPILTAIADYFYAWLQRIDKSFATARQAKRASKTFLRCSELIETEAVEYAAKNGCDVVFCGHTHMEVSHPNPSGVGYYNSGCWTELPCSYITVCDGQVELRHYADDKA